MKNIESPFNEKDFDLLRMSFSRMGKKHGVTGQYVGQIASGNRPANTRIAKAILNDLKELLEFLTPKNNQDEKLN